MPSDLKRTTARQNGAKSRGPVTPEGKRNSARNNLRHGLLAGTVVIDSESLPRFRSLLHALQTEFAPHTPAENALVETMAVTRWRQLRLWALEKSALDSEMKRQAESTTPEAPTDAPTRAFLAFRGICDQSRALELINRYETRYDRQFLRLVRHFQALKSAKNIENAVRTQQETENNDPA